MSHLFVRYQKIKQLQSDDSEVVAQRCSVKKVFLEVSQKFAGKYLCQEIFFNKVASLGTLAQMFCKISKNSFSYRTPPVAASGRFPVSNVIIITSSVLPAGITYQ